MSTLKNWTRQEDAKLASFVSQGMDYPAMAEYFGVTAEEVSKRHDELLSHTVADAGVATQADADSADTAITPPAQEYDPLQLMFLDFCKTYELMGEQLKIMGEIIGRSMSAEQTLIEATDIEAFRGTVVGDKLPAHLYAAQKLHERFILLPRPVMVPRDPSAEQQQTIKPE